MKFLVVKIIVVRLYFYEIKQSKIYCDKKSVETNIIFLVYFICESITCKSSYI